MGLFERNTFPFTNFQNLNLDWIIRHLKTLETRVDALEARMTQVEADLRALEERMTQAEADIDSLEERMTQAEADIDALEARADALEERMTQAEADIDALESRMTQAEADIDALEARMTTAESDIDALEARADALEERMTQAEADIDALEISLAAARNDIANQLQRIISLENWRRDDVDPAITNLNNIVGGIAVDVNELKQRKYINSISGGGVSNPFADSGADLEGVLVNTDGVLYGSERILNYFNSTGDLSNIGFIVGYPWTDSSCVGSPDVTIDSEDALNVIKYTDAIGVSLTAVYVGDYSQTTDSNLFLEIDTSLKFVATSGNLRAETIFMPIPYSFQIVAKYDGQMSVEDLFAFGGNVRFNLGNAIHYLYNKLTALEADFENDGCEVTVTASFSIKAHAYGNNITSDDVDFIKDLRVICSVGCYTDYIRREFYNTSD